MEIAARHSDPRTTVIYDHRRQNFDKHAAYIVAAFVRGRMIPPVGVRYQVPQYGTFGTMSHIDMAARSVANDNQVGAT